MRFFQEYCPSLSTEDVLQNTLFVSTFSKNIEILSEYKSLEAEEYLSERQRKCKSKLSDDLSVATKAFEPSGRVQIEYFAGYC